ncbi:LytR C-terminal domain-containing protein [Solirubrobacter ginsenosidimutans]|uniref:LytR C-terminal domain-containing protein n=1 Tax=Solirubrobacter ginsenosidimutans TaxID=490573 RepID=A0A9X3N0Y3_9ACTN|nr:LytR C-terminal domain-containing protein [Solirubrobacter ginsenosidimutans]MDA0162848.1 LytR C-terminal domain-containing protein [Solirubrobacter ginsenosidimutans]
MSDFLKELELQLTAAAHRKAAERARPPRPRLWPTLSFVAAAAVAVVAMILLPGRPSTDDGRATKPKAVSLADTRIGVYNAAGTPGLSTTASRVLVPQNWATAETVPPGRERKYSTVYFSKGHAAQARRVAQLLDVDRVGSPPPSFGDGKSYDVVAVLGQDYATPARRLLDGFAFLREATNRTVETAAGPVRVLANRAGLCLQVHDGAGWGGTCVDIADALAGQAVISSRQENERLRSAVGLVPDGVAVIELHEADGTTRRLQVGRNVWAVGAEKVISVSFDGKTIEVP